MPRKITLNFAERWMIAAMVALGAADGFAQIQDTDWETWTAAPIRQMSTARWGASALTLQDGRVLVIGGSLAGTSAEIYHPGRNEWNVVQGLTGHHVGGGAVLLNDGRVLVTVMGGINIFDPSTDSFSPIDSLRSLAGARAAKLPDGRVLLLHHGPNPVTAELFDPAVNRTQSMGLVEAGELIALRDGRVTVIGDSTAVVYTIEKDRLRVDARHSLGRELFQRKAVLLTNGTVLVAGGSTIMGVGGAVSDAVIFDPATGRVRPTGGLLYPQKSFGLSLLPDGRVLSVGGEFLGGYFDDAWEAPEIYDPGTGAFTMTNIPISSSPTALLDGTVLFTGTSPPENVSLYIPATRAFSSASGGAILSPGSMATLYGARLAPATETASPIDPPFTLGGISIQLLDRSLTQRNARILSVSRRQIVFEVPFDAIPGPAHVRITGHSQAAAATFISPGAAGLFHSSGTATGYVVRIEDDGRQTVLSTAAPIVLDHRPTYLVLYGTGLRGLQPADVRCLIDDIPVPVLYVGPEGNGIAGLDQVNVLLPASLKGRGPVKVVVSSGFNSNAVTLRFQ